jgi:hypothetical protein
MENEIFYGQTMLNDRDETELEYFLIPEHISEDYCDLMCYGIKVKKTTYFDGGGKTVESKQINNVFYSHDEAERFIRLILKNSVTPTALRDVVEDYIVESIDRAKRTA